MRSSLGLPTATRSQQGHGYSFHMGLTDFTRRHGSEEKAMRTETTVAGQMYHLSKILCCMTPATRLQDVDHSERKGGL